VDQARDEKRVASEFLFEFDFHFADAHGEFRYGKTVLRRHRGRERQLGHVDRVLVMIFPELASQRSHLKRNAADGEPPRAARNGCRVPRTVQRKSEPPIADRAHEIHGENVPLIPMNHAHENHGARADKKYDHRVRLTRRDLDFGVIVETPSRVQKMQLMEPQSQNGQAIVGAAPNAEQA